ncbi:hypothetical protein FAES_4007 [Fibrella aestuarina BUZ 2]|uniref:DUF4238 domain-containing protein n=1 Tax=Fibrella aestuarina BUZ 2 TaxID=1166018 RepID=I0KD04_9BACT|nr:DUF4238 domain-containing protein [Fibrella aestuarina]CCH02007.1 hypothetical protein FAES_4007 [Fibrella aestuarina BUZ 2]
MNPPKNQHYLPQVYLKQFVNSQHKLYTLVIKAHARAPQAKEASPKSTGCAPDYFTLTSEQSQRRLGITDPYIVEKRYNAVAENKYGRLIPRLLKKPESITGEEAYNLLFSLLSFKHRNPVHRYAVSDPQRMRAAFIHSLDEVNHQRSSIEPLLKEEGSNWAEFLKDGAKRFETWITDPATPLEIQVSNFIRAYEQDGTAIHQVTKSLLTRRWFLLHTAASLPFISSDNPGFCVDWEDQVRNLGFNQSKVFFFPLTPRFVLCIRIDQTEPFISNCKRVWSQFASPVQVAAINRCSFVNSYQRVIGQDRLALVSVWHDMCQHWPHLLEGIRSSH